MFHPCTNTAPGPGRRSSRAAAQHSVVTDMAPKKAKSVLSGLKLDAKRYVPLLTKLMAESESLQNNPAQGLYPREDNCSQHVLEALAPYSKEGGPLTVERISFAEGRGNVIITYKGTGTGSIAFVGRYLWRARSDLPPTHALT